MLKSNNNVLISITSHLFIHTWIPKNKEYLWGYQNIIKAFFSSKRVLGNSFHFISLLRYLRNLKPREDVQKKSGRKAYFQLYYNSSDSRQNNSLIKKLTTLGALTLYNFTQMWLNFSPFHPRTSNAIKADPRVPD